MEWGKSSDTPVHSGFVSTDQSPRFVLHLCMYGCMSDSYTTEDVQLIYLYVALLTYYIAARVLALVMNYGCMCIHYVQEAALG